MEKHSYLLLRRYLGETEYHHYAIGTNIEELKKQMKEKDIAKYRVVDFYSGEIVFQSKLNKSERESFI